MSCSIEDCKVKNEHRLLMCWLCEKYVHFQCAGFKGRDFDRIVDRSNGLRWSCSNCRSFDINFYKLLKDAKAGFSEISKEFFNLNGKFKMFENLFNNFDLSHFAEASPKRKKSQSCLDVCVGQTAVSPTTPNLSQLFLPSVLNSASELVGEPVGKPAGELANPPVISIAEVDEGTRDKIEGSCGEADVVSGRVSEVMVATTGVTVSSITDDVGCGLVVVPPRKTVFVSRFAADTSEEAIRKFLRSNCPGFNESDFNVQKFRFSQPRDISSFKIIVPLKLFDILVEKSFWPVGALVREYIHRDRPRMNNVAVLPKN